MRRVGTETSAPSTDFKPKGKSSNRKLRQAEVARTKQNKRYLFYGLLGLIVLSQVVVLPLTSHAVESTNDALTTNVRGRSDSVEAARKPADGSLNTLPVYLRNQPFHSNIHCVGETHNPDTAWMYRSCEFSNLCLDVETKEFFLVESPIERQFHEKRVPLSFVSTEMSDPTGVSTTPNLTVALGGINPRWVGHGQFQGIEKVKWFPKIRKDPPASYYQLDEGVTLVPFHSFAAHNVGHMLWDDFLPIFTLLSMFGRLLDIDSAGTVGQQHFMIRVDTLPLLYSTCEMQIKKGKKLRKCTENLQKFLPLLGVDPSTYSTLSTVQFQPGSSVDTPKVVCATHAVAGLGMLTDHGMKDHGWLMPMETQVQNTAKGPLLYSFRNYMLKNIGLPIHPPPNAPFRIVLSAHSSNDMQRDTHFVDQQRVLSQTFPSIQVQNVDLASIGMKEQVELLSQTQVFISVCGGGTMTATFLPKGATLILYYAETGGYDFANDFNLTGTPAMLDWDLFNNMAHLRVHWLPIGTMRSPEGWKALTTLVRHELDVIESGL
eukprot:Nitzschia sp. Nitz4//scaffold309_size21490//82//1713//NITZ4_008608-RA/size21490-processed-gene-0.20-mRNA-1//1//CDS//3329547171//5483//frame0